MLRGSRYADIGNGTLVFGGLDRRPFGRILGGLGIFSDSYVRHFLSKPGTGRRTVRRTPSYSKDATQRKWCWDVIVSATTARGRRRWSW